MALDCGTKLGHYEIVSPLGKGGMGEVYRARDARLDRDVAVKVLPAHLTRSPEFKQRFEREAKSISQLAHPNICTLHDVGHHDGTDYLVMELLEGETLAQRLARGSLPLDHTLRFGAEIAGALDAAHRKGVVHRDLKPGNIMLTKTGTKLLDFGLAKTTSVVGSDPSAVTVSHPLTSKGTILGTFQYMAPEQLEGKEADERTDIFAFGAVLYEMATGHRAFEGQSRASLIASIMSSEPRAISELQPMTPPALDHLMRSCLAKDPDERIQTAHDVKLQLQWIAEIGSQIGQAVGGDRRPRRREQFAWLTACLALFASVLLAVVFLRRTESPRPALTADLVPPDGTMYVYRSGPPALSPDGRLLVFAARTGEDTQLWLRDLERARIQPLPGTAGGSYPFWSPDSRSFAFYAGRHLKRMDVGSGRADIICEAADPSERSWGNRAGGGTWNRNDVIVFARGRAGRDGLFSVPAAGGELTRVTELDEKASESAHRAPWFLPDGKRFLFSTRRGIGGENGVSVGSLDGAKPIRVLEVDSNAVFVEPGYVLYWRDGAVRGQPFDPDSLTVTGLPFAVAPKARFEPDDTVALFSVSTTGILAYHPGESATAKSQLVVRDRTGKSVGTIAAAGNYYSPRYSHDGSLVAVDNSGVQNNGDIWVYGVETPTAIRVTSDLADESAPIWSPADDQIVFLSGKDGPDSLYAKELKNLAVEQSLLVNEMFLTPTSWSPDGSYIAFNSSTSDYGIRDIWLFSMNDGGAKPLIESPFSYEGLVFSPDGRWIAYSSDETGQSEIYLQNFPEPKQKYQVSVGGGMGPRWRGDGKELFYRALDDSLMVVSLETGSELKLGALVPLFRVNSRFQDSPTDYDVAPDGQTFVVNTPIMDDKIVPMSLLVNWSSEAIDK